MNQASGDPTGSSSPNINVAKLAGQKKKKKKGRIGIMTVFHWPLEPIY